MTGRPGLWTRWLAVLAVAAHPLIYWGMFAGDATIHLAYAEHAAQGHFFEFNRGEVSSGVTSPGYMLLLAVFFRLFSPAFVPLASKLTDVLAWYGLAFVVWRLARRIVPRTSTAAVVAFVAAMLPGSVYNSTVGMENGLFALVLYSAVLIATDGEDAPGIARESLVGLLWAAAIWLRPEGIAVTALWYGLAAVGRLRKSHVPRRWSPWLAGVTVAVAGFGALAAFELSTIGTLIPASGRSRMWMASLESVYLGPIPVDPKFAIRLFAYAPLTAAGIVGTLVSLRKDVPGASWLAWRFLAALFWLFFGLYSTALGAAQLARYVIFLMPALCLLAGLGIDSLARRSVRTLWQLRGAAAVSAIFLVTVFGAETRVRLGLGGHDALAEAMRFPEARGVFTANVLSSLGDPTPPVSVGLVEVQARYYADDRIVVRSLDGRTDAAFLDFVGPARVDYLGYLRYRHVDFVTAFPDQNRDRLAWSLRDLLALPPDGEVRRDDVVFRRLGDRNVVKVTYLDRPSH